MDKIIRPVVLPHVAAKPGMVFQQDNAPPNAARLTQQFLQANIIPVILSPTMARIFAGS